MIFLRRKPNSHTGKGEKKVDRSALSLFHRTLKTKGEEGFSLALLEADRLDERRGKEKIQTLSISWLGRRKRGKGLSSSLLSFFLCAPFFWPDRGGKGLFRNF